MGKTNLKFISQKNVAKMAILWPKMASATLARALPMAITWPFFIKF